VDHERRCARILRGEPLQVLTVGSFSFRKGALDLAEMAQSLKGRMNFRFVGDVPPECRKLRTHSETAIEFVPRQSEFSLPAVYREGDLFVFPTIEDGYAVVLAQARAAGLPILATTNSSAPDIVHQNESGWILPIRNPAAFVERLEWCDAHRNELATILRKTHENFRPRDWWQVASDLMGIFDEIPSGESIGRSC
jgi:glycosyltransferase involved in cell wall biosynthesis